MVLAGIVLLAACANLGSLFAARTADRAREIAIRMAIGASRWRILRQILVEALVISILGGVCACILAWMALSGLATWQAPTTFPIKFLVVMPQPSLTLIAFLISVLAGVLFGVMPLRQIFKTDPNEAIKSGGSLSSAGRRWVLRDVLLAAQIALCCVTVTAAFVSLRGLGKALTMDMGFNPKNVVRTEFDLSQAGYPGEAADHFQRQLLERVRNSREWKQQATRVPRPCPSIKSPLQSSLSKLPISDPQTRHLIPISTTPHRDTWPPREYHCSPDAT
jgi:hypothetical protein